MPDPVRPVAPREDELEALKRAHALLNKHQIDWLTHHGVEQTDLSVGGHDGRGSETSAEGRSESHDARLGRDAEVSSVRQTDGAVDCARDIPADSHLPLVQGAPVAVSLDPHQLQSELLEALKSEGQKDVWIKMLSDALRNVAIGCCELPEDWEGSVADALDLIQQRLTRDDLELARLRGEATVRVEE